MSTAFIGKIVVFLSIITSLFHIWTLNFHPLSAEVFRTTHVMLICLLVFLSHDYTGKKDNKLSIDKVMFCLLTVLSMGYAFFQVEDILQRGGVFTTRTDLIMGIIAIVVIFEATRRTVGLALPIIASFFIAYAFYGKYIPGFLGHTGYDLKRVITTLYTYDGIFGMPVAVAATFVVMFVVFGAFLEKTGAGDFFLQLAKSLAGKQRGGPAKIAVVASGFFGSISGSAVANVVGTGTFTIPLMKKTGYSPTFAAAVEAAASTGGQIMPPVMAAGAFLMAEILGVPYTDIMKAAIIPAVLYFATVWMTVDLRAARIGLLGLPKDQVPNLKKILAKKGYMLLPLLILIYYLVIAHKSPIRSAFVSMISCIVIMIFEQRDIRKSLRDVLDALCQAGMDIISIAPACACAGVVIGAIGLTGLGLKIASIIISIAAGRLWLGLILSMITAILFGMGLPTTVSYILCASILAPALIELGIPALAAHLFIFYFACLSGITPPVALAAYAGAGISGSNPMETGFAACRLAAAGFILPYMFAYNPVFLLIGEGTGGLMMAVVTAVIGCYALASASEGWFLNQISSLERLILLACSVLLIKPGLKTDGIGLIGVAGVFVWQYLKRKKKDTMLEA
ncbi:MAG: TRAP transporter permease [bacterium]|jgi:TRAP transporter 4TM/12TM fusion protein